jgi:tetratricopeptide (TPR) repeat protein
VSCRTILIAILPLAFLCVSTSHAATPGPDFQDAIAALQRGDAATAEQKIRAELAAHPDEAEALSLLGVALDNQKKFPEAEDAHLGAIAKDPRSPGFLHNYGNHLLLTGDLKGAHDTFMKLVELNPADDYANLQLAQLALEAHDGKEALQYLELLPAKQLESPTVAIYMLMALDLSGKQAAADALFGSLAASTESDANLSAFLGRKLAQARQFAQAETFLTHALAADLANFGMLYELGAVASNAGHNERARDLLENALRQQPQNVDVLYALAYVYSALNQPEAAVRLLAQAEKLAPQRADIHKLLAVTTGDLHAYEDSVHEWDIYVTLAPNDDAGRRERGFSKANIKQAEAGLADLEWYVARHPDDPKGLFELGVSQAVGDPEKGIATLDKAVALKPDYVEARAARGALNYQQGKAEVALPDLEFAAANRPDNALMLDRLGQAYLLLERLPEGLRVLRKAAELAPSEAKIQLHVANALAQAGQTAESKIFMNRYKELGGSAAVPARGVMDYLNLTPEQQHAAYRARIEKALANRPDDAAMQTAYLKLSIGDGQMEQASGTARKIAGMKPGAIVLADAGRAMLAARQYGLAKELLNQAATADPAAGVDLDLAIAGFHADGAAAGLEGLQRVPLDARGADYYLARAQMLDASGKPDDAAAAIRQAVRADPGRVDLYWQAVVLMTHNNRGADAVALLDEAAKAMPDEAQIAVLKAVVLDISGKAGDALTLLNDAQRRWPEAAIVRVAEGEMLAAQQRFDEARKALETAVSLGAHSTETLYALAEASFRSAPPRADAAEAAIGRALSGAPGDAQTKALAGRIAAARSAVAPQAAVSHEELVDPAKLFQTRPPRDW